MSLEEVQARFREHHGGHPMTPDDETYAREHFVPVADPETLGEIAAGRLPLPAYLLPDGTPMVPRELAETLEWAGGTAALHDWWRGWYAESEQAEFEDDWAAFMSGQCVCLKTQRPGPMRRKRRFVAQARTAAQALRADPRDHLARGSLGEALDQLDDLLLPMTGWDRVRFGEAPVRERLVEELRVELLTPAPPPLPIRTERLVLRRATVADRDDMYDYLRLPEVCEHLLRDSFTPGEVEGMIRRGHANDSGLSLVIEHEGRVIGDLMLVLEKPGHDKAEMGWVIHPAYGGNGLATEAARALLDLAFEHYGVHRVRAELDGRNHRSAALAQRLGMRQEGMFRQDYWSKGEWTDTPHFAVLEEEWRAARDSGGGSGKQ